MKNRLALQSCFSRVLLRAGTIGVLAGPVMGTASVKAGGTPQNTSGTVSTAPQGGLRGSAIPSIQGYRVGEIRVIGPKALPSERVGSLLGLVPGEIYDESKLRKGIEGLKKSYGTLGFITFLLEPIFDVDEQRKVLNVTVNIDEGLAYDFNRISFTGNTTIPDEVLRREMREIPLKEGFLFDSSRLERFRLRLNQLGLFEEIKIEDFEVTPSPDSRRVDIVLKVKEKQR